MITASTLMYIFIQKYCIYSCRSVGEIFTTFLVSEGKDLASSFDAKFIETSAGLKHNVDELLVGVLKQILLRQEQDITKVEHRLELKVIFNKYNFKTCMYEAKRDLFMRKYEI